MHESAFVDVTGDRSRNLTWLRWRVVGFEPLRRGFEVRLLVYGYGSRFPVSLDLES